MRRLLSQPSDAARAWDAFFFTPADPTPLGPIRLATGLLLLWSLGVTGMDLHGFLGSTGWADPDVVRQSMGPWAWSLWLWVPDALLRPAWVVGMLVTLAFALGLGSRVSAPLAWAFAVSTARRAPVILFGFDQIVTIWAFYLAVTGAGGRAWSLDRLIARRRGRDPGPPRPSVAANLALRLIQLHLCWIYLFAGLAKLLGPSWWDGSAIGKLLGNSEFRPFDLSWVAAYPGVESLLNLATHLALAVEVGYAALIWVRGLRPWVLAAASAMHVGIAATLGLTEFSLAMLVGNLAFVPAPWLQAISPRRLGTGRLAGVQSSGGDPASPPKAARPPVAGSRRPSR